MTDNDRDRVNAMKARFQAMGTAGGEPTWSSWLLQRLLDAGASAPGASLREVYLGLDAALNDDAVPLTRPVANLIKDTVITGFSQHRQPYQAIDWTWAGEALSRGASPARCYLFLHALPPDVMTPDGAAAILRALRATDYEQEALAALAEGVPLGPVPDLTRVDGEPERTG
jgi:hypothetical protein